MVKLGYVAKGYRMREDQRRQEELQKEAMAFKREQFDFTKKSHAENLALQRDRLKNAQQTAKDKSYFDIVKQLTGPKADPRLQITPAIAGGNENFGRLMRESFDQDSGFNNFPYHDIVKTGDTTYNIEVALAGYSKNEISVEYSDNLLRITSEKPEDENKKSTIHQGISKKYFSKVFSLADEVEIKGAEFKDGLLKVSLKRIVP